MHPRPRPLRFNLLCCLTLLVTACGPNPDDLAATAQALADQYLAGTQTAAWSLSPTSSPTSTNTPAPSPTATPLPTQTFTPSPSPSATFPPPTITPTLDPKRSAPLLFQNKTDGNVYVILTGAMYGEYAFSDSNIVMVPWGTYNYRVWIDGVDLHEGSFTINNLDKYTLVIEPDKVHVLTP
jgi:hypothetical protein